MMKVFIVLSFLSLNRHSLTNKRYPTTVTTRSREGILGSQLDHTQSDEGCSFETISIMYSRLTLNCYT